MPGNPLTPSTGNATTTRTGTPDILAGIGAVSWTGTAIEPALTFPRLDSLAFRAEHQGRIDLLEQVAGSRWPRGRRVSPGQGTVDIWLRAPAAGTVRNAVLLGTAATTFVGADLGFLRIGIDASNDVTVLMQDVLGTDVIDLTAATPPSLVEGPLSHVQFAWDAVAGTAKAIVNGVEVPAGDYATAPAAAWNPAIPHTLMLAKGTGTNDWTGTIDLVQIGNRVEI